LLLLLLLVGNKKNIPTFLSPSLYTPEGGEMSLLLGSAGSAPIPEGSVLSSETLSQVEDPADPTTGWLLDSPLREAAPISMLSLVVGVV
jgi:hypothetical protein